MLIIRLAGLLLAASAMLGSSGVFSRDFPVRPIRILTSELGGGSDIVARLVAQAMTANVGEQVIVDNRGGSGIIPGQIVAKAAPDGYTLLLYGSSIWLLPLLQQDVPFDREKDFSPITTVTTSPNILVVHPSAPAQSVTELIALAKARPGGLNYGSGPSGTASHLTAELFKSIAGVNVVRVPYKGMGPALTDLITGQVQLVFATAASAAPHLRAARVRALAVTSPRPSALFPGVPTVAAALPGCESVSTIGMFAPARTPAAVVDVLNREIVRVLSTPEIKEKLFSAGVEVAPSSPRELTQAMRSETATLGKVIRSAGIRAD